MAFSNTYFSLAKPSVLVDHWLNPYKHSTRANLKGGEIEVRWTGRADRKLKTLGAPLNVEMQLYFSCVVLKRVLFKRDNSLDFVKVNGYLNIAFRLVQSSACDPVEFAANHPVKRDLTENVPTHVHPQHLKIDYRDNQWTGEFFMA